MDGYVKDVFHWNEQMKVLLEEQKVAREEDVWKKLHSFTESIEGVTGEIPIDQLQSIQQKADQLHNEINDYFTKRQTIGTILMKNTIVPIGEHTYQLYHTNTTPWNHI